MRLYLIRHALTRPTGLDSHLWPLSQEGEAQAAVLAEAPLWNDASVVYSSPEDKALATVQPASAAHGLEVKCDERLREARRPARWIGDYEGVVRRYLEIPGDPLTEWEDAPEVRERMVECIREISARHSGEAVAVCGHGLALTLYLSTLPSFCGSVFDLWRSIGFAQVAVVEDSEQTSPFHDPGGEGGRWGEILRRFEEGPEDRWLERWQTVLETSREIPILELGCGGGQDARFLTGLGFSVIATDLSEEALELTRRRAPDARVENVDLTRNLPFPDAAFQVIVASLSLHYFPWRQTLEIVDEVHRCLKPQGHLLARFNSTRDPHYSGAEKHEIGDNFYLIGGMPKRLFDRRSVHDLFGKDWEVLEAEERVTLRFGEEKLVWEVAARKAESLPWGGELTTY